MKRSPEMRRAFDRSNDWLRRVRRRYARVVMKAMERKRSDAARDAVMDAATARLLECGVYKHPVNAAGRHGNGAHRMTRGALLSLMKRMTPGYTDSWGWSRWRFDHGWQCYEWRSCKFENREVAA